MCDKAFERCVEIIDTGGRVNILGWKTEDVERLMKRFENEVSITANREGVWFKKWVKPFDPLEDDTPSLKEQFKAAPFRTLVSLLMVIGYQRDKTRVFNNLLGWKGGK